MKNIYKLQCKYCAHEQLYNFEQSTDFEDIDMVFKYDYEEICNQCGSFIRINESMMNDDLLYLEKGGFI